MQEYCGKAERIQKTAGNDMPAFFIFMNIQEER